MNDLAESSLTPVSILAIKEPAYVWKTGVTFYLSKKEKIVADTYVRTQSWKECERALKAEGIIRKALTCKRWYEGKEHIKQYVHEQLEVLGVYSAWTKERWMKVMHDHLMAKAEIEEAKMDMETFEQLLLEGKSLVALSGFELAKNKFKEAKKKQLGSGDLYGMSLIAKVKHWEMPETMNFNSIILTQANGRA